MGEQAFVVGIQPSRTAILLRKFKLQYDPILLGTVILILIFGLLMVFSAGPKYARTIMGENPDFFLWAQARWIGVGIVAAAAASFMPYQWFRRLSVAMIGFTLLLLILVPVIGTVSLGASRSLLSGSIRPSELAKLVIVIYMAVWLFAKQDVLNQWSLGLVPLFIIAGVISGLIFIQPDFSAAVTVVVLAGLMFYLAGGDYRKVLFVVFVVVAISALVVMIYPNGQQRIMDYIKGIQDPLKASEHVRYSLSALINGGLFGVGLGRGSAKFGGLPVAVTDSIFAVIAEEFGLIGSLLLIIGYLVILWRGILIARNAPDFLGSLLAGGISVWIVLEAFLNISVMVNLLPQAGNALPFISYGGSSMVVNLVGIGILMNIFRQGQIKQNQNGRSFSAVVNLRGRDRRRSVPRPIRPANIEPS